MVDDHDPTTPEGAAAVLDELAARALAPIPGGPAGAVARAEAALEEARQHLHAAHLSDGAGTVVPDDARLRSVKSAVNLGLRPVTSHQVPFNRELVATVGQLIDVVEELTRTVAACDIQARDVLARATTAIATTEVGQAAVEEDVAELTRDLADLQERTARAEEGLAAQRRTIGAARVREDLVLRAARAAVGGDPGERPDPLPVFASAAAEADAMLLDRLTAVARPAPGVLWAQAQAAAEAVSTALGTPVVDLASGRGEWLDAWVALAQEAQGVESDPVAVADLDERGHAIDHADPLDYLRSLPDRACGAITAAMLADVVGLDGLIALVDGTSSALRPGGVLVLSAATPASLAEGSALWADPRRRVVHPDLLVAMAFERGFAEAEVVAPAPPGEEGGDTYVLIARTPGAVPSR